MRRVGRSPFTPSSQTPKPARRMAWRPSRTLLRGLGLALLLAGGAWLAFSATSARWASAVADWVVVETRDLGLIAREVKVIGRDRTSHADLLAAIDLRQGDALLTYDLEAARRRVEALPWVRRATIARRWPDQLEVRLVEREPVALWRSGQKLFPVDMTGTVIEAEAKGFDHLPILAGGEAPRNVAGLFAVLALEPALQPRVKAAILVSGRRWNLRLDKVVGGIEVRLPEDSAADAWIRLGRLHREGRLLDRAVTVIDLRLPDRLVVRTQPLPGAEPAGSVAAPPIKGKGPGRDA